MYQFSLQLFNPHALKQWCTWRAEAFSTKHANTTMSNILWTPPHPKFSSKIRSFNMEVFFHKELDEHCCEL